MASDYIFVYGSLRREFSSPARSVLEEYAEYVGKATFQGQLYQVDWFPGVFSSKHPEDHVLGEVHKINDKDEVFARLDRYEGCSPTDPKPHMFTRKQKQVKMEGGEILSAWIYLYTGSVQDQDRIRSGDFLKNRE